MARQKNPAAAVIAFFQSAELPVAEAILGLAKATVAERRSKPRTAATTKRSTPIPTPTRSTTQEVKDVPALKPPRTRKPKDVALPGIQGPGPVSEVGG